VTCLSLPTARLALVKHVMDKDRLSRLLEKASQYYERAARRQRCKCFFNEALYSGEAGQVRHRVSHAQDC